MEEEHICHKEAEIAEVKQMLKSLDNHTQRVYDNWHDIKMLQEKQLIYEKQHEETLQLIREINECQQKLIIETVETKQTFKDINFFMKVIPVLCTILTFILTYVLH